MKNTFVMKAQSIPWMLNLFGVRIGIVHGLVLGIVILGFFAAVAPSQTPKPKTVLIVDDNPSMRQSVGFVFRFTLKWNIVEAGSVQQALAYPKKSKPDLIILDNDGIADNPGHTYVGRFNTKWPGVPVIIWSDSVTDDVAQQSGAQGRLPKNADDDTWIKLISELVK